jgi:hypothetical protein
MNEALKKAISSYTNENIEKLVLRSLRSREDLKEIPITFKILQDPSFVFFSNLKIDDDDPIFSMLTACYYLQHDCSYISQLDYSLLEKDETLTYEQGVARKLLRVKTEFKILSKIGTIGFRQENGSSHGHEHTMAESGINLAGKNDDKLYSSPGRHNFLAIAALLELSSYILELMQTLEKHDGDYDIRSAFNSTTHLVSAQKLMQHAFYYANQNHRKELENYVNSHIDTIKAPYIAGSSRSPKKYDLFYEFAENAAYAIWKHEVDNNLTITYPTKLVRFLEKKFMELVKDVSKNSPDAIPENRGTETPSKDDGTLARLKAIADAMQPPLKPKRGGKQRDVFDGLEKKYKEVKFLHPFLVTGK